MKTAFRFKRLNEFQTNELAVSLKTLAEGEIVDLEETKYYTNFYLTFKKEYASNQDLVSLNLTLGINYYELFLGN